MDWQSVVAISIVVLAGFWGAWMLLAPFVAALRPRKNENDGCGGGCGCSSKKSKSETGCKTSQH